MADDEHDVSDDVFSMASTWDSIQSIRTSLRAGDPLLDGDNPDIKSSVANKPVLLPVLQWMANRPGQKLPEVDQVRTEIRVLYVQNKVDADACQVGRDGWLLRKYLGFIKMKVRRGEVSIDPWKQHMQLRKL